MENKNLIICSKDCIGELLKDIGKSKCNLISIESKYVGNGISEYWVVFEGDIIGSWVLAEDDIYWLEDYGYDEEEDDIEEIVNNYINSVKNHNIEYYEDDYDLYNILSELYYKGKIIINGSKIKKVKLK